MAEILGIIASTIALGQGMGAVTKGMQKMVSLRHAPAEFHDLHNELVTILRYAAELEEMQDILKSANLNLPSTSLHHLKHTIQDLGIDVNEMRAIVLDFEASASTGKNGERAIRKFKWVRKRTTIAELRDSVRRRRSHLSEAMMALQTFQGIDQSKTQRLIAINVQNICETQLPTITESTSKMEERLGTMESQLGDTRAFLSSSFDNDNEMTRVLLERTESMTQALKEVQDFVRVEKQRAEANTTSATVLQENMSSIESEIDMFDTRVTELDSCGRSTQEEILSTLNKVQESLKEINTRMRSYSMAAKDSEKALHRLLRPQLEDRATLSLVSSRTSQEGQLQRQQLSNLGTAISIQSTADIGIQRRCKSYCQCSCHRSSRLQTPGFLTGVVGNLLLSYNSIPIWKPRSCNNRQCGRRSGNRIQLNYMFPRWMLQTCISLSLSWSSSFNSGASLHLSIPRFNPNFNNYTHLMFADVALFQKHLFRKTFSITDVGEDGTTLLLFLFLNYPDTAGLLLPSCPKGILSAEDNFGRSLVKEAKAYSRTDPHNYGAISEKILDLADEDHHSNIIIEAVLGCTDFTLETALSLEPSAIDEKDDTGKNALCWAVAMNDTKPVQTLLSHGSDVTLCWSDGSSALHQAAANNNAEMVQILVEAGSHLEERDDMGRTPLLTAAFAASPESLEQLLNFGANALAVDNSSWTAFHCMAYRLDKAGRSDLLKICSALQEAGLDQNSRNETGSTALMLAVQIDHVELAKALAQLGADFQAVDDDGWTLLHFAALFAKYEMIQALRSMKIATVDTDLEDLSGWTAEDAFQYAASLSEDELISTVSRKPTKDEIIEFGLLISEIRERYRASRTSRFAICYQGWTYCRVADRKCHRYAKKNGRRRRTGPYWKVPMRNIKRKCFHSGFELEIVRMSESERAKMAIKGEGYHVRVYRL